METVLDNEDIIFCEMCGQYEAEYTSNYTGMLLAVCKRCFDTESSWFDDSHESGYY